MAKGMVRKSFAVYLMILFFMVLAAALITVVIMFLSPGKSILGFKFFKDDGRVLVYNVSEVTDPEDKLDFTTLETINIEAENVSVEVLRSDKVNDTTIRISKTLRGFAKENQNTTFSYNIAFDEGTDNKSITVKFTEPQATWFLSKSASFTFLIPTTHATSFENTTLNIKTKSGNVYLGNADVVNEEGTNEVRFKNVNIETTNGDLVVRKMTNQTIPNLTFKSEKGRFTSNIDLNLTNFTAKTKTSRIKLGKIKTANTMLLDIENSKLSADTIEGNIKLYAKSAEFNVDIVKGDIYSEDTDSAKQMEKSKINIKEITGSIALMKANKSSVTIDKINSDDEILIMCTTGNVNIKELNGKAWIETTTGKINVESNYSGVTLRSTKGNITYKLNSTVMAEETDIYTVKGKINITVSPSLGFILDVKNTEGEERNSKGINIELFGSDFTLPLQINEGTKFLNIESDGKINVALAK